MGKFVAVLPVTMDGDEPTVRAALTEYARRAGHHIEAEATIRTRRVHSLFDQTQQRLIAEVETS